MIWDLSCIVMLTVSFSKSCYICNWDTRMIKCPEGRPSGGGTLPLSTNSSQPEWQCHLLWVAPSLPWDQFGSHYCMASCPHFSCYYPIAFEFNGSIPVFPRRLWPPWEQDCAIFSSAISLAQDTDRKGLIVQNKAPMEKSYLEEEAEWMKEESQSVKQMR